MRGLERASRVEGPVDARFRFEPPIAGMTTGRGRRGVWKPLRRDVAAARRFPRPRGVDAVAAVLGILAWGRPGGGGERAAE